LPQADTDESALEVLEEDALGGGQQVVHEQAREFVGFSPWAWHRVLHPYLSLHSALARAPSESTSKSSIGRFPVGR